MKSTVVDESLSSFITNVLFQRIPTFCKTNGEVLTEVERKHQSEEENYEVYDRIYMGQLSDVEDTNMDNDNMSYIYFRLGHEQSKTLKDYF